MQKTINIQNKKARFQYEILDKYTAGIVLTGTEIKSIRQGHFSIKESYVRVKEFELYIVNMNISKYEQGNIFNHDEKRDKKLLMSKRDIIKLGQKVKLEGLTIVPTKVYLKEGLCKLEIALCKGKKLYDKRETQKQKDIDKRLREFSH